MEHIREMACIIVKTDSRANIHKPWKGGVRKQKKKEKIQMLFKCTWIVAPSGASFFSSIFHVTLHTACETGPRPEQLRRDYCMIHVMMVYAKKK